MRSKIFFLMTLALVLVGGTLPARASSLFLDDGSTASLGAGDVIDNVILIETAHVDIGSGAQIGRLTLLDQSTASWTGGDILISVEVFNLGVLTIETLDTAPTPFQRDGTDAPPVITSADCPACLLSGTLADGSPQSLAGSVLQGGEIQISPVPEPTTAALFLIGLLGLAGLPMVMRP